MAPRTREALGRTQGMTLRTQGMGGRTQGMTLRTQGAAPGSRKKAFLGVGAE